MEKLIKLLNQFIEEEKSHDYTIVEYDPEMTGFETILDGKVQFLPWETVRDIRYGFIDWLFAHHYIDNAKCMEDEDFKFLVKHYEAEDAAHMVLATRYSAIDLLCDRLK